MSHGWDGARLNVPCLSYLSWNSHSSRICVSKEGDGTSQAGMVAGGISWWDSRVSGTQLKKISKRLETYVKMFFWLVLILNSIVLLLVSYTLQTYVSDSWPIFNIVSFKSSHIFCACSSLSSAVVLRPPHSYPAQKYNYRYWKEMKRKMFSWMFYFTDEYSLVLAHKA